MLKLLAVVVTGCLAVMVSGTSFKDCGSQAGSIKSVDVIPCASEPCPFKKGTYVNVTVVFTANEDITAATNKVNGIIAGVHVPFPLKERDACKDMTCPVKKGSKATYENAVFVEKQYPSMKLVVEWQVIAQDGKSAFCFEVPVMITP